MKMEQTECAETSAYKIQMPGNYPKESTQHSEHGESLKSLYIHANNIINNRDRGSTVVKVLCYKSEGRWFDPSWCHWNFL